MKKIHFVFHVSEVPDFDCLIHRRCGQQPLTSGVKLHMSHLLLVQFQLPNLQQRKQKKSHRKKIIKVWSKEME